jgi:ferrochelatase
MPNKAFSIVLTQLGGPANLEAITSFQYYLFEDVLSLLSIPKWLCRPLAWWVARVRTPKVKPLYEEMGHGSPILPNTNAQAEALRAYLSEKHGMDVHVWVAMRYAPPRAKSIVEALRKEWEHNPEHQVVVCPLYPQYSFATTRSSQKELNSLLSAAEKKRVHYIESYEDHPEYIRALADSIATTLEKSAEDLRDKLHLVFSAHGLPMKLIRDGDPYPKHILKTVAATVACLEEHYKICLPHTLCYQSRVGPIQWLKPSTQDALKGLADKGDKHVAVIPVAFVSEHIETLQELDVELYDEAKEFGIETYLRVPTVGVNPYFIAALADKVLSVFKPV